MKRIMSTIFVILFLLLSSCSPKTADKIYNVTWKCSAPVIEFRVGTEEEVYRLNGINFGYLYQDDKKIDIVCLWTYNRGLDIFYKDLLNMDDIDLSEDNIALNGSYTYDGSKFTLKINLDNVYNHQYKKLVFTKN